MTMPAPSTRLARQSPAGMIGLLIGLAAATPGAASPIPGFPVRPWHAFILMAFALALLHQIRRGRTTITRHLQLDIAVIILTAGTLLVELINAVQLNYAPDYMSAARPVFWLIIYWSIRMVCTTLEDSHRLLKGFVAPVFPSVALGFAQVLGIDAAQQLIVKLSPESTGFANRLESGGLIRATGLVQHWTSFGSYLCTVTAAAAALLILARSKHVGSQLYAWTVIGATALGVLTTFTLSSIVTAFAIFILCSTAARAVKMTLPLMVLVVAVGIAAVGPLIAERLDQQFNYGAASDTGLMPSTLQYRYRIWQTETIPMIKERPIVGWGSNVYDVAFGTGDPKRVYPIKLSWYSPESQWLSLLMISGGVGLFTYLLVLILTAKELVAARLRGEIWISRPTSILFLFMLAAAFTAPVFFNHGLPVGLWTLLALVVATRNRNPTLHDHS